MKTKELEERIREADKDLARLIEFVKTNHLEEQPHSNIVESHDPPLSVERTTNEKKFAKLREEAVKAIKHAKELDPHQNPQDFFEYDHCAYIVSKYTSAVAYNACLLNFDYGNRFPIEN